MRSGTWAAVLAAACLALGGNAGAITISATDSGHFEDDGAHFPATNENYIVGTGGVIYRNFFVFDLTGVLGPGEEILSAKLRLESPAGSFLSADPTETYGVFHVLTPAGSLLLPYTEGPAGQAIWQDLGDGALYGSAVLSEASENTIVEITLSAAAIANLESASGLFAFGGAITTIDHGIFNQERAFGFTDENSTRELVLTIVPEPGSAALLMLGLAGLARCGRRR